MYGRNNHKTTRRQISIKGNLSSWCRVQHTPHHAAIGHVHSVKKTEKFSFSIPPHMFSWIKRPCRLIFNLQGLFNYHYLLFCLNKTRCRKISIAIIRKNCYHVLPFVFRPCCHLKRCVQCCTSGNSNKESFFSYKFSGNRVSLKTIIFLIFIISILLFYIWPVPHRIPAWHYIK